MSIKRHKPWLPMEENRCKGHRGDDKRLRDDCKTCVRRIANRGNALYWIQPTAQVDGVCPNAIQTKP